MEGFVRSFLGSDGLWIPGLWWPQCRLSTDEHGDTRCGELRWRGNHRLSPCTVNDLKHYNSKGINGMVTANKCDLNLKK